MALDTCFVIMAIGDQSGDHAVTAAELKRRYDDLIREALLRAAPGLEIVRADDIALPGSISSDIITRIMHSTFVVADVTYPNPNVYYELGLRHACRSGTVIIRDRNGPRVPFDISHLRYIDYENTATGLKDLSGRFKIFFEHFVKEPRRPDNQFQELAKLMQYKFPDYAPPDANIEADIMMEVLKTPQLLESILRAGRGEAIDQAEMLSLMAANPKVAKLFLKGLSASGQLSLFAKPA